MHTTSAKNNKRGISPLIATVLLIGFTVALAAMIMTWGTGFFDDTTKNVNRQKEITLTCTSKLDFQIQVDCQSKKVFVDNRGAQDITALTLRLHKKSDKSVEVLSDKPAIVAFAKKPFDVPNLQELNKVDAIANVQLSDGSQVPCSPPREVQVNCP